MTIAKSMMSNRTKIQNNKQNSLIYNTQNIVKDKT